MFLQLVWFLAFVTVQGCNLQGTIHNLSSSFTDFASTTLTIAETYSFTGTDCTYDVTVQQEIEAGGTPYFAETTVLRYDSTPIPITYHYTALTLANLSTVGPTVLFLETYIGGPGGGGSQLIFLPAQTTTSSPSSVTVTTTPPVVLTTSYVTLEPTTTPPPQATQSASSGKSGGISGGVIGGIIGGILGGCLLAAGGIIYWFHRRRPRSRILVQSPIPEMRETESSDVYGSSEQPSASYLHPVTSLRYPEDGDGELSARTIGGYS